MKTLSISYVVPTLNSAATLDMTLYSLRSQKNVNIRIIVVDSGSTDGTLDICKRWDVEVLYTEPGNIYRAINVGLNRCDTEWLGYINSDDWLYLNSLEQLIEQGNISKSDVVYGRCDFTDDCGRFIYSFAPPQPSQLISIFKAGTVSLGFAQQSAIFRNSLYHKLQGFNEDYRLGADKEFYFRAIKLNASFAYMSGLPVACFRIHKHQLSNKQANLMLAEGEKIQAELAQKISFYDRFIMMQWRLSNAPHYLLRFLRQSLLLGKPTLAKSMQTFTRNLEPVKSVTSNP